jgi:hypothetical protein
MKRATKEARDYVLYDADDEEYEVPTYRPRANFSAAEVAEELGCEIVRRSEEGEAEEAGDVVAVISDEAVGVFFCKRGGGK